jgi:hypothetical protein
MFVAALVAAFGLMTFVVTPAADAIVIHVEVAEGGIDPNAPPPEPTTGQIVNLCLTVRAYSPNPVGCISI